MPSISFTQNLARHLDCPDLKVEAQTLLEALNCAFEVNPRLRGYLLDDQGAIRKHVAIFIDNQPVQDRQHLSDRLECESDVFVMQALSGG